MDSAVLGCWNAERSRRYASSQNVLDIAEAEWERFHDHNKQRKHCVDLMKSRNASRAQEAWANQELPRHSG